MSSKKTKEKLRNLSGVYAKSDNQVIIETWKIRQQKIKSSHLGLSEFLNRFFSIKKSSSDKL